MSRARLRPARATVIAGAVTLVVAGRTVVAAAAVAGAGDLQQCRSRVHPSHSRRLARRWAFRAGE